MYIAIIHVYVCNRSVDIVMQVIYTTGNIANTVSNATTTVPVVVGVAVAGGSTQPRSEPIFADPRRTTVDLSQPSCVHTWDRVRNINSYAADAECPCCVVYQ